mgnify:CR=1 FL=1
MNFNQLKYFISIAETNSVTQSAEDLHLSQPALSRGIRQLEEELGVELFQRLPRAMRLTRYGESFLKHAQSVFVQLSDAQAELKHLSERIEDEIVIGAGPSWIGGCLPDIVGQLSRSYPGVSVKVHSGYDQQLTLMLRQGALDFILTEISSDPDRNDLLQEPLIHCPYVVVSRSAHPLAQETNIPLERLLGFSWAMPYLAMSAQDRLIGLFQSQNLPAPAPLFQSTSFGFIMRLLETSDALSFVVSSSLKTVRSESVVALNLAQDMPVRHAGIVRRPSAWLSPATETMMEMLRAHCEQHPTQ